MTKEKCLKLFYKFLVKNGILFEYLEYIQTNGFSTIENVYNHCTSMNRDELFNWAFTWHQTKQDYDFWKNFDVKWRKILKNYKDE